MRLKSIKLMGFKSFVEPTKIELPRNITAIVGPNGCGKSNTIDAVRWVLGELSAKYLRGASMAEVIFNGSLHRTPLSQAAIELHFDNTYGRLGGEYNNYTELLIRRQVSRDGQSNYYLNGSRCRRKDITDIFLGTGLGPRSYAIIEQGTISRLIEAKPHELRSFLEEAAGISRYKERRKETEQRIEKTQGNLTRLFDLREELGKQVTHLERQAKSAEKYKQYKAEERILRAKLLSIQSAHLQNELEAHQTSVQHLQKQITENENLYTQLSEQLETQLSQQEVGQKNLEQAQQQLAEIDATIRLTEQTISHNQDQQTQIEAELKQVKQQQQESSRLLTMDSSNIDQINIALDELHNHLEKQLIQLQEAKQANESTLVKQKNWQQDWQQINNLLAQASQTAQVEQTRIQQMEQRLQQLNTQKQKLQEEQQPLQNSLNNERFTTLNAQLQQIESARVEAFERLQQQETLLKELRLTLQNKIDQVYAIRREQQQAEGKLAGLQTLQQGAQVQQGSQVNHWLKEKKLDVSQRLLDVIEVEQGFELYLENYFGEKLQAIALTDWESLATFAESLPKGALDFFSTLNSHSSSATPSHDAKLGDKVKGPTSFLKQLENVYYAENFQQAHTLLASLGKEAEIITQDGLLLKNGWLQVRRASQDQSGALQRKREITQLQKYLTDSQKSLVDAQKEQQLLDTQIATAEELKQKLQVEWQKQDQVCHEHKAKIQIQQAQIEQTHQRLQKINQELTNFTNDQKNITDEHDNARHKWQQALSELETHNKTKEILAQAQQEIETVVQTCAKNLQQSEYAYQENKLKEQRLSAEQQGLKVQQERTSWQQQKLQEREQNLIQQTQSLIPALQEFVTRLQALQAEKMTAAQAFQIEQKNANQLTQNLRHTENERKTFSTILEELREKHTRHQVEASQKETKMQGLLEQLQELELDPTSLQEDFLQETDGAQLQTALEELLRRIERLGAINLAAIEELTQQLERKTYYDTQHEDLTQALATLQTAIREIDQETQAKFQSTFETVNNNFQTLFPKIFSGGNAYLSLVSEDLLETGVSVFAQPPGKRNSSIHLLSGGEKALTALALVFAIFELNPAPFCMLDEVDAPLDDVNVGRFCNLVKAMAEKTQFIVVTHNKVAMEMADHLLGVTMHEPGVSRLVTVDVEAAIAMAAQEG